MEKRSEGVTSGSPLLRILAVLAGAVLGFIGAVVLADTEVAWVAAAILGGVLGLFLARLAERTQSDRGVILATAVAAFLLTGAIAGFVASEFSGAGGPIYRGENRPTSARRCGEQQPRPCDRGRGRSRAPIGFKDPIHLGWALGVGVPVGAVGAAAGGALQARSLPRRRRDGALGAPLERGRPPEVTEPAEGQVGGSSDRKRRRSGVVSLLAGLPFAAAAIYFLVSCSGGSLEALYMTGLVWFVATCFGLYRLNLFAIRRGIWNLISAAIVAAVVEGGLLFAAFWVGFSRCFTF